MIIKLEDISLRDLAQYVCIAMLQINKEDLTKYKKFLVEDRETNNVYEDNYIKLVINVSEMNKKYIETFDNMKQLDSLPIYSLGYNKQYHKGIVRQINKIGQVYYNYLSFGTKLYCIPLLQDIKEIMDIEQREYDKDNGKISRYNPVMNFILGPNNYSVFCIKSLIDNKVNILNFLKWFENNTIPKIMDIIARKDDNDIMNLYPSEMIDVEKIYYDSNIFLKIYDYKNGPLIE